MLGLLDLFHAFVVLQRFRHSCRTRVTDVVVGKTARIAMNTQNRKVQGIVLDQMRGCAQREREGKERKE